MSSMEVNNTANCNSGNNVPDGGNFASFKAFVDAALEFESTHSEASLNLMNVHLNLLASTSDLSIFAPGRSEVCELFSSLWRVMRDSGGPHWAGVALLSRACNEPSARQALTHTYQFMPWLSTLLSSDPANGRKIQLLSTMQRITYGIKIIGQEPYLPLLMKSLTDYITGPFNGAEEKLVAQLSLSVLANLCSGNLPAKHALMKTVDTQKFVGHLVNLTDGGFCGGVADVCRLQLGLSAATRGAGALRQADVNTYFSCAMLTFKAAILEKDEVQLLQAYYLMKEMCSDAIDANLRVLVGAAPADELDLELEDSLKTSNCNEVLIRLEQQVKAQAQEIEEANALERSLKKEIELKELTIKHHEETIKHHEETIHEYEKRLLELNIQLEEKKSWLETITKACQTSNCNELEAILLLHKARAASKSASARN